MKNHRLSSLVVFLAMAIMFGLRSGYALASFNGQFRWISLSANGQQPAPTPVPTDSQSATVSVTPVSRLLPPVGSNAGLVIGASVLVLIVIGGVLIFRRKQNH